MGIKNMNSINPNSVKLKNLSLFLFFIFTINFLIILNVFSQVTEQWAVRYNGPGNSDDGAYAMAIDSSGNVYVTGGSVGSGTDYDYATIKYNNSGVQQWEARYNGLGNIGDGANAIAVDASGNVYVTGYSMGTSDDYATIMYNSVGVQQWASRYDGLGNSTDCAEAIAIDNSGNVYVTGGSMGSGTAWDYATIKYNSAGVQQWASRYDGPVNSDDYAKDIAVDTSGNVYVTGYSSGSGTVSDYATIKYNSAGVQQWASRYDGPGNGYDVGYAIAIDSLGNVYVTGDSGGLGTIQDYATIKYNNSGVQQWASRYDSPVNGNDCARPIVIDSLGNVYVTGWSEDSVTMQGYATIKYNSLGAEQWVSRYNGPGNGYDYANSIAIDNSGNVYITGWSGGLGTSEDYATIKYNNSGIQQWAARYNAANGFDEAHAIAIDSSGNVYVTGGSEGSGTGFDYATIKYSQGTSIKDCIWSLY